MHLMIPCASALDPEPGPGAARGLGLPHLSRLLGRLTPTARHGTDERSLNTPFEHALAAEFGWLGEDGCLPWAAHAAAQDGIDVGARAWGQLTPVHWHVATDHVSLADPAHLHLSAQASRTLFEAVRPLFEEEGWELAWGGPCRWYAAHDSLAGLPCASLDRVIGRDIDLWLPASPQGRLARRLQNEVQMLLYRHPLNDERVELGALPVNSFWLSGCGRPQAARVPQGLAVDTRLRAPLLGGDGPAWAEAWREIDGTVVKDALERLRGGAQVALTLAGERHAQRFESLPRGWVARWRGVYSPPAAAPVLEAL